MRRGEREDLSATWKMDTLSPAGDQDTRVWADDCYALSRKGCYSAGTEGTGQHHVEDGYDVSGP